MLPDIENVAMAREAVAPIRTGRFMGLVTFITVELHRRVFWPVDLDRLFDSFFRRPKMRYIESAVSDQFLPDFLSAVTEEAFFRSGPEV